MDDALLTLLRAALWNAAPDADALHLDEAGWNGLFAAAKAHAVQGLVFDAVRTLPSEYGVPQQLSARWLLEVSRLEKTGSKVAQLSERMEAFWRSNGVKAVLLKGVRTAAMYSVPEHRVPGDIDFWIPGRSNRRRALELVRERGFVPQRDSDGDFSYTVDGITVEHHRKGLCADGPEGVLVLMNGHILHHVMVTGIGLRHICDMAVAYRHFHGRYDVSRYAALLERNGMLRWTALLDRLLESRLAMPVEYVPVLGAGVPAAVEKDVERLWSMILADGNFGLARERRFSGFFPRLALFARYAPRRFAARWLGLVIGRCTPGRFR